VHNHCIWNEDIAEGVCAFAETVERHTTAMISPAARYLFNLPNDVQLVIGAALAIGLTRTPPLEACSFISAARRSAHLSAKTI
jgi:hypothetical protein